MKLKSILSAFAATMLIGGAASAATIGWSEGQREQVVGTQVITPTDASNAPPGFFLGSVRGGETIDLHGRIVKSSDFFTFTAKRAFSIEFIFGGYAEVGGPGSAVSGLTAVPVGDRLARASTSSWTVLLPQETRTTQTSQAAMPRSSARLLQVHMSWKSMASTSKTRSMTSASTLRLFRFRPVVCCF